MNEYERGRQSTRVAGDLRKKINSGEIANGQFLPSVRTVAEEFQVNRRTAVRALRSLQREGLILAEPRRGYRVLARAGDPDRGLPVAYVAHAAGAGWDDFHQTLLSSFQQEAARRGWSLLVAGSVQNAPEELRKQLVLARVCGAILDSLEPRLLGELADAGIPVVLVDGMALAPSVDVVVQDGELGSFLAAQHLLARNHRRIGWLGPDPSRSVQVLDRFSGATGALAAAGAALADDLRAITPLNDRPAAMRAATELLRKSPRPTAFLALWQDATKALVASARELGLVPGRDFEMIGWSTDEHYASHAQLFDGGPVAPAVTWKISDLAGAAVRCLQLRRADPAMARLQIRVPTRLVV